MFPAAAARQACTEECRPWPAPVRVGSADDCCAAEERPEESGEASSPSAEQPRGVQQASRRAIGVEARSSDGVMCRFCDVSQSEPRAAVAGACHATPAVSRASMCRTVAFLIVFSIHAERSDASFALGVECRLLRRRHVEIAPASSGTRNTSRSSSAARGSNGSRWEIRPAVTARSWPAARRTAPVRCHMARGSRARRARSSVGVLKFLA